MFLKELINEELLGLAWECIPEEAKEEGIAGEEKEDTSRKKGLAEAFAELSKMSENINFNTKRFSLIMKKERVSKLLLQLNQ